MAKKIGFKFKETMYGHYEASEGPDAGRKRRFVFLWEVNTGSLLGMLRGERTGATGWVEAEGLAEHATLEGSFVLKPVVQRFIRYDFTFTGDDGHRYRFEGQKELRHLHPARTWTTLPGAIFDDREMLRARSLSRFRFSKLLPFLFSFRLTLVEC